MFVDWFKNVSAMFVYVYEIYATLFFQVVKVSFPSLFFISFIFILFSSFLPGLTVTTSLGWAEIKLLQPQIYFLTRINAPAKRFGHSLTNQLAERINSFFLSRTIFSSPFFGVSTVREPAASSTNRSLSHHCYWFHLEPYRWRTRRS